MYKATVIEVFIASPSDIIQEKNCFREIVDEWNVINSKKRMAILKPVEWEQNVYSSLEGQEPQAIINKQILEKADLLVGIFWTRIGTPTKDYESGTIEEIKKHMQRNKPIMLFFSNVPVVPSSINNDQYEKLVNFKNWCEKNGTINTFDSTDDFKRKLRNQLGIIMNDNQYFLEIIGKDDSSLISENQNKDNINISEGAQRLLREISLDSNGQLMVLSLLGGYTVETNGKHFGSEENDPREIAQINAEIEELEQNNLIKAATSKRDIFTITAKGYDLADKL